MAGPERWLVDTNVLLYGVDASDPRCTRASAIIENADGSAPALCIAPQVAAEFCAVVTAPRRAAHPLTADEAREHVLWLLSLPHVRIIVPQQDTVTRFVGLLVEGGLTSQRVFDALLAATMLDNGVTRIYTEDATHFARFAGVTAINPFAP